MSFDRQSANWVNEVKVPTKGFAGKPPKNQISLDPEDDQMYKEFIQFLERINKNIPTAIKDLKKGNISQTVAGLAHAMGGISVRESFYDYFFS